MRLSLSFGDALSESFQIWVMRLAILPQGALQGVAIRVVGCSPWRKMTTAIAVCTPLIGTLAGSFQFILLQTLLYQLAKLQPPERLHRSQVASLQPSAKSPGGRRVTRRWRCGHTWFLGDIPNRLDRGDRRHTTFALLYAVRRCSVCQNQRIFRLGS